MKPTLISFRNTSFDSLKWAVGPSGKAIINKASKKPKKYHQHSALLSTKKYKRNKEKDIGRMQKLDTKA